MPVRPFDVKGGCSFASPQGWVYRVNVVARRESEEWVDYTVRTGPLSGHTGETTRAEFARRMARPVLSCGRESVRELGTTGGADGFEEVS